MNHVETYKRIEQRIQQISNQDLSFGLYDKNKDRQKQIQNEIISACQGLSSVDAKRIQSEFLELGPIDELIQDENISEIMIRDFDKVVFEKNGSLYEHSDHFFSEVTYREFVQRICAQSHTHINIERPCTNGKFLDFRLHMVGPELTGKSTQVCLRRHPKSPWTLSKLKDSDWAQESEFQLLENIISARKNFLVVGGTGSGKTSLLNACLQNIEPNQRAVLIEDTPELTVPNGCSTKLLTRFDAHGILPPIDQQELVRQSLRMRPDRLVMGEIRGTEAKDLLMALSTGHDGSFATLHASSASQALLRLEMLIQLGAPMWSLQAIRNLMKLSLQNIIVVGKTKDGLRRLLGIYELSSIEDNGILLERLW